MKLYKIMALVSVVETVRKEIPDIRLEDVDEKNKDMVIRVSSGGRFYRTTIGRELFDDMAKGKPALEECALELKEAIKKKQAV